MTTQKQPLTRRGFLHKAGAAGIGVAGLGLLGGNASFARGASHDGDIIEAATIAEALATTMYYNLIAGPIYAGLNVNDQSYLVAGLREEVDHYALLVTSGGPNLAGMKFYFPPNMFTGNQITANTLVTLEDAFISAYAIGVRDFSSPGLRVLAARILGVESEHRALGRVIAADLGLTATTNLLTNVSEDVNGPTSASNNLSYERLFFNQLSDAVNALGLFLSSTAFSTSPYTLPAIQINADGSGTLAPPMNGTTTVQQVTLANDTP